MRRPWWPQRATFCTIAREQNRKGTIGPGKLDHLAVLDRDLLTVDPDGILEAEVDLTIVDGEVLYELESDAGPAARAADTEKVR